MITFVEQGRVFKEWLKELNEFDHVNTLPTGQQRLATRIYVVLLTSIVNEFCYLSVDIYSI